MSFRTTAAGALVCLAALAATAPGEARNGGIAAEGCEGCHSGGKQPAITLDVSPAAPKPGESVTVTVTIPSVNGGSGGIYLRSNGKGTLATIAGQPTKMVDIGQMVHTSPKAPSGGLIQFTARWTAPMTAGGATLSVWGVAANGDSARGGDGASSASKSFAVGCEGKTYYRDWDSDGFGGAESVVDCSKPAGYVENKDDCDDNDGKAHPGAAELCNMRDDNCNGQIDENLVEATHYEDRDGDGYGTASGKTVFSKCPPPGYAPRPGDCDENDPKIHPGVVEICNHRDDNCDGRVDERVRPICGVGMCARAAPTCEPDTCEPGQPKPEKCNGLDDDCDGEVDEGDGGCGAGQVCHDAQCVPAGSVPPPPSDGGVDASPEVPTDGGGCAFGSSEGAHSLTLVAGVFAAALLVRERRKKRRREEVVSALRARVAARRP